MYDQPYKSLPTSAPFVKEKIGLYKCALHIHFLPIQGQKKSLHKCPQSLQHILILYPKIETWSLEKRATANQYMENDQHNKELQVSKKFKITCQKIILGKCYYSNPECLLTENMLYLYIKLKKAQTWY